MSERRHAVVLILGIGWLLAGGCRSDRSPDQSASREAVRADVEGSDGSAPADTAANAPEVEPVSEVESGEGGGPPGADMPPGRSDVVWSTFEGAWFSIDYPADFTPVPQEESPTGSGYDGVVFVSPDEQVELYVNSPQWQGGAVGWIQMLDGEEIVDSRSTGEGSKQTTIVTLKGHEGAYYRIYEDTMDTVENTRLVFGFRYPDDAAHGTYVGDYEAFKASLEQYAD